MTEIEKLVTYAEYLVTQDETELALKALTLLPGNLRDNVPPEITNLRSDILANILMPHDIISDTRELPKDKEQAISFLNGTARGRLLKEKLEEANAQGGTPHILDYGPGDYCFPIALDHLGLKFTYEPLTFSQKPLELAKAQISPDKFKKPDKDQEYWFVAYEIIEHLWRVEEIAQVYMRFTPRPEKVFVSTPKYTFGTGSVNWRTDRIHHLRTYTPQEFQDICQKLIPDKQWGYLDDPVMCMMGFN